MERKKRPGYLTQYAIHAGITKTAAAEQLKRVGIDYMQPFDHDEADKRRAAARHADRVAYSKPIYGDPHDDAGSDEQDAPDAETAKDPVFARSQARKELFRAKMAELDYVERLGKLIDKEKAEEEYFRVGRLVRDALLNIPARLAGIVAAESDQRKVHDLLEKEIRQALEALVLGETGGTEAA